MGNYKDEVDAKVKSEMNKLNEELNHSLQNLKVNKAVTTNYIMIHKKLLMI